MIVDVMYSIKKCKNSIGKGVVLASLFCLMLCSANDGYSQDNYLRVRVTHDSLKADTTSFAGFSYSESFNSILISFGTSRYYHIYRSFTSPSLQGWYGIKFLGNEELLADTLLFLGYVDTVVFNHFEGDSTGLNINEAGKFSGFGLRLYPNPGTDIVNIDCSGYKGTESLQLQIIDMNGRIVIQKEIPLSSHIFTFSMQDLPRGNYVLNISNTQGRESHNYIWQ